jgi:hypothetical protein
MALTLGTGTTLRPYFTTVPGVNSWLEFKDIAPRQIRQVELLDALGRMFNLAFFTDEVRREVVIEPLEEIYDGEEVDLRGRLSLSSGVEIADAGLDRPQTHHFSYKATDYATSRFNIENGEELGAWSYRKSLYGTTNSVEDCGVELFAPTINIQNIVAFAPSASLMQVGDVGESLEEGLDVAFTPHIVCYKGMRQLPNGECWIAGNRLEQYPYAAFLDQESINLCFEDRNGLKGLHTYHLAQAERAAQRERISLTLHLTAAEAANLFTANGPLPSLRSIYRFDIFGESSCYRLVKAESWSAEDGCVRCTFERELTD